MSREGESLLPDGGNKDGDKSAPPPNNPPAGGENNGVKTPEFLAEGLDITKVPAKFVKDGKIDVVALTNSYGSLEGEFTKLKEGQPKAPEKYELKLPEGIDPKSVPEDDPMVVWARGVAKANNWTQEGFDQLVGGFLTQTINDQKAFRAKQVELLGGEQKMTSLVNDIGAWAQTKLSKSAYETMRRTAISADVINMLNEFRTADIKNGSPPINPGDGDNVPGTLTEVELKAIMKKPEYHDPHHADYNKLRRQVAEGYEKLYPDEKKA